MKNPVKKSDISTCNQGDNIVNIPNIKVLTQKNTLDFVQISTKELEKRRINIYPYLI